MEEVQRNIETMRNRVKDETQKIQNEAMDSLLDQIDEEWAEIFAYLETKKPKPI